MSLNSREILRLTVGIGLGPADKVGSVRVRFVGGPTKAFAGPSTAVQQLRLYESEKGTHGWMP